MSYHTPDSACTRQLPQFDGAQCRDHQLPAHRTCERCGAFMCETCSHFGVEPRCDNCPPKRLPSERAERLANALKRAPFVRCLQCEYQGKRLEVHTFLAPSSYACPRCMSAEALVPMMTGEPVPDSEGERLWSEANARNQVVGRANRVVSVVAVTLAFLTALALLLDLLLAPDKRSFLQ